MKKTKIICSIGPASSNANIMKKMVENGMDVARINFSHATLEERETAINSVKEVRKLTNKNVAILFDTKGPEFRNGILENDEIKLIPGKTIRVVKEDVIGNSERFSVNHPQAIENLNIDDYILLENGLMKISVISKEEDGVTCKIINGGILGNKKSLSAPGVNLDLPFVSKEDLEDIIYASKNDGNFLALSFVSSKDNVLEVKEMLRANNCEHLKIISKIESTTGLNNLDDIIDVSDGIMVARGDLGVEVQMEELPYIQRQIVNKCREKGKFCIVATEMLESMKKNARPTRAEVSDISNAVLNGADAVMLSGETSVGNFPTDTVKYMADICKTAEKYLEYSINSKHVTPSITGAIASSVVETANILDAKLIVAATMSGSTATIISNLRPKCLVLATCPNEIVARSLALNWGVYPIVTGIYNSTDDIVNDAIIKAKDSINTKQDDIVIITGGFPNSPAMGNTNFMKIEKIK